MTGQVPDWFEWSGNRLPVPFAGRFSLGVGEPLPSFWAPEYKDHVLLDFAKGRLTATGQDGATVPPANSPGAHT